MSYTSGIKVRETESMLRYVYHKTKGSRMKLRVKALLLFNERNFQKQEDLAFHLFIGYSILRRWFKKYMDEGFENYIREPVRGKPKSPVTPELNMALANKLKDSHNPLLSYLNAVIWVKETHGIALKYHSLKNI